MEFVKNNWLKLVSSIVLLAGVILSIILLSNGIVKNITHGTYADNVALSNFFMSFAQFIFFVGLFAYVVMSMFEATKEYKKYVLLVASLLALLFVILCISFGMGYVSHAQDKINAGYNQLQGIPDAFDLGTGLTAGQQRSILAANQYELTSNIFNKIFALVVYSLLPLFYAVKKCCVKRTSFK